MNVYIDLDKVANLTLDRLIDKVTVLAPGFNLTEEQRESVLKGIMNSFDDYSDNLEDLLENLLVLNFEENARTTLVSLTKLFGGNNND